MKNIFEILTLNLVLFSFAQRGAPVAPALIVNVIAPGVELKHNTVNGAVAA
jgi:hypothetical protein